MLILSRKPDQEIVIDGQIRVTVLEVRGSRVLLGIDAPVSVRVCREELQRKPIADRSAGTPLP